MWIVAGSEVMVRRYMHSNAMVWVLYGESVCCDYDHVIRKVVPIRYGCFSGLLHIRVSRVLLVRNKYIG